MKLRCRNWNIILHLRLVLQNGLIPLLHTWFLHTLFKTFRTEHTCYLILIATEDFAIRIYSKCRESEIKENTHTTVLENRKKYKSEHLGILLRVFQQFFTGGPVIKQ